MKQPKQPSRLSLWFCRHLLLLDGVSIAAMLAGALVKEYLSRPIPRPVNALCGVLVFGGVGGLILFSLLAMPAMALHCPNCGRSISSRAISGPHVQQPPRCPCCGAILTHDNLKQWIKSSKGDKEAEP